MGILIPFLTFYQTYTEPYIFIHFIALCFSLHSFHMCYCYILRYFWTSNVSDLLALLGWTGLFCPCVLFGRNVQALREDIPWTTPCTCHAVCVEGGIALAILTAIFHGVDPGASVLIGEGLVFSWWLCSTYTGIFRQQLQKKYHLEVVLSLFHCFLCLCRDNCIQDICIRHLR
jgi:Cys-rich protein (TIGR01571 family)